MNRADHDPNFSSRQVEVLRVVVLSGPEPGIGRERRYERPWWLLFTRLLVVLVLHFVGILERPRKGQSGACSPLLVNPELADADVPKRRALRLSGGSSMIVADQHRGHVRRLDHLGVHVPSGSYVRPATGMTHDCAEVVVPATRSAAAGLPTQRKSRSCHSVSPG